MPKHVRCDTKAYADLRKQNDPPILSLSSHTFFPLFFLSHACSSSMSPPLSSSVNCLSLAPLEGDVYYLVLRPLLDFSFSSCGVCSMPLRWKNALIMISIIVFGIMVKKKQQKKQEKRVVECCTDSTRDVVFFKREHKLKRWSLQLLPLADGNKMACQSFVDV